MTDLNIAFERIGSVFDEHKVHTYLVVQNENISSIHTLEPFQFSTIIDKLGWKDYPFTSENYHCTFAKMYNVNFCVLQLRKLVNDIRYLTGFIPVQPSVDLSAQISFYHHALIFPASDGVTDLSWDDTQQVTGFTSVSDAIQVASTISLIREKNPPIPLIEPSLLKLLRDAVSV